MNTQTLTLIHATPNDLPYEFAQRAHHNITHYPEQRARQCQDEYMQEMASIEAEFAPHADEALQGLEQIAAGWAVITLPELEPEL